MAFSFAISKNIVVEPTCYTVQLISEPNLKKNHDRLSAGTYDDSCVLMKISNNLAVRCGCFDTKKEVTTLFEELKKEYSSAKITKTYSHRFEKKTEKKSAVAVAVVDNSSISKSVDYSNYKEVPKRESKIIFNSNVSDTDGVYNYDYKESNETNVFIDGNFDKIHRYASLYFSNNALRSDSNETFKKIKQQIHTYTDDKSREIGVSIIGFTQKVERKNDEIGLDSEYTNFFQNIGKRDNLNPESASDDALNYMQIVYEKMLDDNISKEIIYKENRVGRDNLYTEALQEGREQNNRVDVAIYVKEVFDPDTDKDGVRDSKDYCPETPLGAHVDQNGCPLIMSLDLLFDFDKATISDKESIENIKKVADFMNKYPVYRANIIGHTDSDGSEIYNKKLSMERALAVKILIVADDINASRLSYEGRGESEPLFENINPFNRHKNRRTEVELIIPQQKIQRTNPRPRRRGRSN